LTRSSRPVREAIEEAAAEVIAADLEAGRAEEAVAEAAAGEITPRRASRDEAIREAVTRRRGDRGRVEVAEEAIGMGSRRVVAAIVGAEVEEDRGR
jgi:hypothetical protein